MFEPRRPAQSAAIADVGGPFPQSGGIDFQRLLSVLWRDKATILWTTAAALVAVVLFVLIVPARYTAVTQILIDPTDLRATANDLTPINLANEAAVLQVESQVRVLTSDSVLRRVVKSEALDQDPDFVGHSDGADSMTAALNALKRSIQVKRAERTYVVDIAVSARDPARAAHIANAIAQAYLEEQTDVRSDAARQISQSLSGRLNELKDRVRRAEDKVEAFKVRNNILGSSGTLVNEQQLTEMNNELSTARARAAAAKARLDQIQQVQLSRDEMGAFPEAVQSPTVSALRSQYAEVMRREAEQMSSLGPRHPAVIEIQAEAERLRHTIDDEVRRVALSARTEYESAHANEEALAADLEKLKGNAVTTNEAMVTLRELDRDVQANRAVYEAFLVRARETGEQERVDTKNIRVISWASVPTKRSFPPSNTLLALAGLLFGVAAGSGIVIARDFANLEQPRATGTNPLWAKLTEFIRVIWPGNAGAADIPVLAILPNVDVSFGLTAAENPRSRLAMELHRVHEKLRVGARTHGNTRLLVVASDAADDTVAVALMLAAVVASTQRVLLIDADLERRTLTALDADESEAGLVDIAGGRLDLADVIVRDRESNISFLPFVSPGSRRDGRISEADLRQAFDQTRRFDMVIVAAVELARNPGTSFFAGMVDHIIMVGRTDRGSESAVEHFVWRLGANARKVRGAVLIDAEEA
jgi:succinoglycan biosynthesis transport protein ExoP